jgi:hypothetical protein
MLYCLVTSKIPGVGSVVSVSFVIGRAIIIIIIALRIGKRSRLGINMIINLTTLL